MLKSKFVNLIKLFKELRGSGNKGGAEALLHFFASDLGYIENLIFLISEDKLSSFSSDDNLFLSEDLDGIGKILSKYLKIVESGNGKSDEALLMREQLEMYSRDDYRVANRLHYADLEMQKQELLAKIRSQNW